MADWRENLGNMMQGNPAGARAESDFSDFPTFVEKVAVPALQELSRELEKHGRTALLRNAGTSATLTVSFEGEEEMTYRIQCRMFPNGVLPYAEIRYRQRGGLRLVKSDSLFRSGPPTYTMSAVRAEEIIRHFLGQYEKLVLKA